MSGLERSKIHRLAAGVIGVMMLVIVLFSALFIAAEADHDCTGDDCTVCEFIQLCENNLKLIGSGVIAKAAAVVCAVVFVDIIADALSSLLQETPVSRKVRLNN